MLEQYDPPLAGPGILSEVDAARASPVEVAKFYSNVVEPGGLTIPSPVWYMADLMPLVREEYTQVISPGRAFDGLPDTLSKSLYGTHDLWPLLMELNHAGTRAAFVGPDFVVVRVSALFNLLAAMRLAAARAAAAPTPAYGDLTLRQIPLFVQSGFSPPA